MDRNLEDHVAAVAAHVRRIGGSEATPPYDRDALERFLTDISADVVQFEAERVGAVRAGRDADAVALAAAISELAELRRYVRARLESASAAPRDR